MVLNVICFHWGDWPSKDWGESYIERLANGVARNLTYKYRFICFTNTKLNLPSSIELRPLNFPEFRGCLPKLYAYSPENGLEGRTLVFDLDNVITGNINCFADYEGDFAVRAKFAGYKKGYATPDGDMLSFVAGSDTAKYLWNCFKSYDVHSINYRERVFYQNHLSKIDVWQDLFGEQSVLSYKRHLSRGQDLPSETRIVSFHDGGKPGGTSRMHQVNVPWLKDHWF